jgi:hypothetical protein
MPFRQEIVNTMCSQRLPSKLLDYIPLSHLFNDMGKQIYSHEWDYTELFANPVIPFEEAKQLKKKMDETADQIDNTARSINSFVNVPPEEAGMLPFWIAAMRDDNIGKQRTLSDMEKTLASLPKVEDADTYAKQYATYLRRKNIENKIIDLAASKSLIAYHRTVNGRQRVNAKLWAKTGLLLLLDQEMVVLSSNQNEPLQKVEFKRKNVESIIRQLPRGKSLNKIDRLNNQKKCEEELDKLTQNPNMSKAVLKSRLCKKHKISQSDFNLIWGQMSCKPNKKHMRKAGRKRRESSI